VGGGATICPTPCKLTFDVFTLKIVSESRVTRATSVPILVFLGLYVLDLGPMYVTDRRQTSDAHHRGGGVIMTKQYRCCERFRYYILLYNIYYQNYFDTVQKRDRHVSAFVEASCRTFYGDVRQKSHYATVVVYPSILMGFLSAVQSARRYAAHSVWVAYVWRR